ncbi:hypothetical protein C823_005618 [Eubacterium plexicaudatum ASF492]|uniref:Uncharacterized protein n=1 Tax=Eubacterium plexicaudatum ASF492 TaxID=1235802 RepID=N2AUR4_9FIRM|nr:hypothetical protein C823_005618 [Eubacterium plexicaudatum ASF492]
MPSSHLSSSHKNPSRKSCEQTIKRILTREFEEYGENHHFKQASDFMIYFESLHPASPGLTKQVQRAINALNLPRDENGYFIINKTVEEYKAEQELSLLLQSSTLINLQNCTPILIKTEYWKRKHVIHLIRSAPELQRLFVTLTETDSGILIYTKNPEKLTEFFSEFIKINVESDTDLSL